MKFAEVLIVLIVFVGIGGSCKLSGFWKHKNKDNDEK